MAPEMVTRADTARLFFRCNDPGDPVYSHMTLADAEHTAQLLRERQIQTDLGFADTAEFQALEAAAVRSLRMEYLVQYEQRSFVHAEWLPREAIEAQGWRSRAKLQQYILECRARGVRDGAPIAPAISAAPVLAGSNIKTPSWP